MWMKLFLFITYLSRYIINDDRLLVNFHTFSRNKWQSLPHHKSIFVRWPPFEDIFQGITSHYLQRSNSSLIVASLYLVVAWLLGTLFNLYTLQEGLKALVIIG